MEQSRILVTGATGFLGRHLVGRLIELGQCPKILVRDEQKVPLHWRGKVDIVLGDLLDTTSLYGALKGIHCVFHLAAENRNRELFHRINVIGTRNLMDACLHNNIERLIHLSSIAVFGSLNKEVITEEDQCIPKDEYDRSKFLGEQCVQDFHRKTSIPTVILRPSFIIGEGRDAEDDRLYQWLSLIKRGFFRFFGKDDYVLNFIYAGDVVEAMLISAKTEDACSKTYIISDACPLREFVEWCAQVFGIELPKRAVPLALAYPIAMLSQCINVMLPWKVPFSLGKLKFLTNKTIYSSKKIKEELAFNPPFGLREGFLRMMEWYRENRLLM